MLEIGLQAISVLASNGGYLLGSTNGVNSTPRPYPWWPHPPSVCTLESLQLLDMAECWDVVILPDELGKEGGALPELLELELDLSGCSIKQLPCLLLGSLQKLQKLNLADCQHLLSLPETFGNLTSHWRGLTLRVANP